MQSQYVGQTVN